MHRVITRSFYFILFFSHLAIAQETRGVTSESTSMFRGENYALIVGVSSYAEFEESKQLKYAHKDAELFFKFLDAHPDFKSENITILKNERATSGAFNTELYKMSKRVKEGDHLLIYFAGHGDVPRVSNFGYILFHDAPADGDYAFIGAISSQGLQEKVSSMTNRDVRVTVILDACRSAKMDADTRSATLDAFSKEWNNTIKLLSCKPNELSHEYADIEHGVFTYYLVEALSGKALDANGNNLYDRNELEFYVNNKVAEKTKLKQTPVMSGSGSVMSIQTIDNILVSGSNEKASFARSLGNSEDKSTNDELVFFDQLLSTGRVLKPVITNSNEISIGNGISQNIHTDIAYALDISNKYSLAITASGNDKNIALVDLNSGTKEILQDPFGGITSISTSVDLVAAASWTSNVTLWSIPDRELIGILKGHRNAVRTISLNSSAKLIASGDSHGIIKFWSVGEQKEMRSFKGHSGRVSDIVFFENDKKVASSGFDGKVKLWSLDGSLIKEFSVGSEVHTIDVTPDDRYLIAGTNNSEIILWELESFTKVYSKKLNKLNINELTITKDGNYFFRAGKEYQIELYNLMTGDELLEVLESDRGITRVRLNMENNKLALTNYDGDLVLIDVVLPPVYADQVHNRVVNESLGWRKQENVNGEYVIALENEAIKVLNVFVNGGGVIPTSEQVAEAIRQIEYAQSLLGDDELFMKRLESHLLALKAYHIYTRNSYNEFDDAIEYLEKIGKLNPSASYQKSAIAVFYKKLNEFEQAKASMQDAIQDIPNWTEPKSNLGFTYLAEGKYDDAITEFIKIIDLRPDAAKGYINMAILEIGLYNLEKSEEWINTALLKEPENILALCIKSQIAIKRGLYYDGLKTLVKAKSINRRSDMVYRLQASAYMALFYHLKNEEYLNKALIASNQALLLNPDNTENLIGLLNVYELSSLGTGDMLPSRDTINRLAIRLKDLDPLNPEALYTFGKWQYQLNKNKRLARTPLESLTRDYPGAQSHTFFARLLEFIEQEDQAMDEINKAISHDKYYQSAYVTKYGLLVRENKNTTNFSKEWTKNLPQDPSSYYIHALRQIQNQKISVSELKSLASKSITADPKYAKALSFLKVIDKRNSGSLSTGDIQLGFTNYEKISNRTIKIKSENKNLFLDFGFKFKFSLEDNEELLGVNILKNVAGEFGLYTPSGKQIIPPLYDEIVEFNVNYYKVKLGDKFGVYNGQGKVIANNIFDFVENISPDLIKVGNKNGNGVLTFWALNYQGKLVIPKKYLVLKIEDTSKRKNRIVASSKKVTHYYDLKGVCIKCK